LGHVTTREEQGWQLVVERAAAGDVGAREDVAQRAFRNALRTATATLGSRKDAADIAGDVTVDVLRGLHTLRDPARFDAWVHRITARHTMRFFRRSRREQLRSELPDDLWKGTSAEPEDALALREAMRRAMASLPPRQRLAMALRYVHDLKEADVAAALGCRNGTAAALLCVPARRCAATRTLQTSTLR
jgi:RNA polymerase sigma factor (sigma-70 family)